MSAYRKTTERLTMGSNNSYGMSLGQIFSLAIKRWWIILIAVVLGAALLFAYTYFLVEPMYTASARIGIRVMDMNAYNESMTGQKVAKDCAFILMSDITFDMVVNELNGTARKDGTIRNYSNAKLRGMISTEIDEDTRFFRVHVSSSDPEEARLVCESLINAFCVVLDENNFIKDAGGIILNHPTLPSSPSSPNTTSNVILGAAMGFVLSLAALVALSFLKDTMDSEETIISAYGEKIPVLAVIPDANSGAAAYKKYSKKYGYVYGRGYAPEDTADQNKK